MESNYKIEKSKLYTLLIAALILAAPLGAFIHHSFGSKLSDIIIIILLSYFTFSIAIYTYQKKQSIQITSLSICLFFIFFFAAISSILAQNLDIGMLIKRTCVFILIIGICLHVDKLDTNIIFWTSALAIILVALFVFQQPVYFHESEYHFGSDSRRPRLWPFYEQSPHSSGYYIAGITAMFIFSQPSISNQFTRFLKLALVLTALYLIFGFRSSQVYFTFLAFFIGYVLIIKSLPRLFKLTGFIAGFIASLYIVIDKVMIDIALRGYFDFARMGSGRVGTWIQRFEDFSMRGPFDIMLGSGAGTDISYIGLWWWKETTSHNSFLTYLIEFGILGFFLIILYFIIIFKRFRIIIVPVLVAIIFSSLIGNGIILRPTPLVFFTIASILSYRLITIKDLHYSK